MTGPEHYSEAERLLARGMEMSQSDMASSDATGLDVAYERVAEADLAIRGAQVHATLALVAVTAMQAPVDGSEPGMAPDEYQQWYIAAGVKPIRHDYDDVTNADVFTESELYEMDRDAEFAHDAAADAYGPEDDQ